MVYEQILSNPIAYIEKYFKVISKEETEAVSKLVSMKLWKAQRYYLENRTHRDIVLKGRQMGLSTGIMAGNSYRCFTFPYTKMSIITHKDSTSQFLLQTVSRFWRNLPPDLRPETDWHAGRHMRFPKLDSYIHVDTAESDTIGFGETLSIVHCSEMSRWPVSKEADLFNGFSQTVPEGGFITIESTPRGRRGLFYNLYEKAKRKDINYKTFFFPWWWDEGYRLPVEGSFAPTKEETILMNTQGVTPPQIMWRRRKIAELGDNFYQEYPENDVDCFISSDISIFDGIAIRSYMRYVYPGRQEGNVTIWKDVIGGEKYVMGVDVASGIEAGDYSVASVLNVKRNEYVARIRGKIHPDLFAQDVMHLAHRFNDAEIAVERTGHGHMVLKVLLEANYPNLYLYEDYDSLTGVMSREPGWKTTAKSKPIMVDSMKLSLRAGDIALWSDNFLNEAAGYTMNGNKMEAGSGAHDDELMALMIALQIREQSPISSVENRYRAKSYI